MTMRIGLIGEAMIELAGTPLERRWGGDTLNTAVYLARQLGAAHPVHYLSALGDDSLSDGLLADWQAEGIATERIARLSGRLPGLYLVETDDAGERRFHYWRSDSAARHWFAGGLDFAALFDGLDAVYLSGITLALFPAPERKRLIEALAAFRRQDGRVWFDNNYRPQLWPVADARDAYAQLYAIADIALVTEDDETRVFGDDGDALIARVQALGCSEIVVKRGAAPATVISGGLQVAVAASPVERVVDTCAAGDSFAAAYLAARLLGATPADATRSGHRLAGLVIQYPGAIMPTGAMPR
ncbi:sugar kinase [Jeongeupia chitinilytica]|uniref:Ketodeoxygluconokinase n=1 Tax=Jeongeupia chitinilytica TaxID=1041641 RepID=A0ABQ3H2N3_9NEIS|nr:sugar kinase [Jeongeupia chitinilytica]GHD67179.1 ketodeoxygluconokinase [Jeongeupia chitinilytica]